MEKKKKKERTSVWRAWGLPTVLVRMENVAAVGKAA
jgi:hypothetical protein